MDETVAYMMMPGSEDDEEEGGGGGTTVQPTQLVALQTEDGTQQLAVPIIDPTTGQVRLSSTILYRIVHVYSRVECGNFF